ERLFRGALEASRTPTARAFAYRDLGSFYAADVDQVEKAREMFRLGVKQLEGEWDPASQFALADTYGAWGAMEADKGDAAKGRERAVDGHLEVDDHVQEVRGHALPGGLGHRRARRDRVHADVVPADRAGHVVRHRVHGRLGHAVVERGQLALDRILRMHVGRA